MFKLYIPSCKHIHKQSYFQKQYLCHEWMMSRNVTWIRVLECSIQRILFLNCDDDNLLSIYFATQCIRIHSVLQNDVIHDWWAIFEYKYCSRVTHLLLIYTFTSFCEPLLLYILHERTDNKWVTHKVSLFLIEKILQLILILLSINKYCSWVTHLFFLLFYRIVCLYVCMLYN